MLFRESPWFLEESLENADYCLTRAQGHNHQGTNVQIPAGFGIDARVPLRVIAGEGAGQEEALAGDTGIHVQPRAEGRSSFSGTGKAGHQPVAAHGNSYAAGAGQQPRKIGDALQRSIDIELALCDRGMKLSDDLLRMPGIMCGIFWGQRT